MSQPMRGQGGHLVFPQCHKLSKRRIKSCFLSSFIEFHSAVSEKKSKMSHAIRGQGGHLVFFLDLASWQDLITIERFQRSWKCLSQSDAGTAILFFQSARKYKLSKRRIKKNLTSCQVSLNSIQRLQRRSRKCLSQSEADRPEKTHKLGRGR